MDDLVIYEKSTCTKCRAASALLDASGREYRRIRYHDEPLNAAKILELALKIGVAPRELVRTNEARYKEIGKDVKTMTDEEVARLLADEPDLLQRPILECGTRAVLGRPTGNVAAFLKEIEK
jgi:arsenate reductase (glutaredoxin)